MALALPEAAVLAAQLSGALVTAIKSEERESTMTPAALAQAGQLYAAHCAACHGAQGQGIPGGSAPSLGNARDLQQVRAMISNGAVEMPAFALRLSAQDIELLSAFVVGGLPSNAAVE